MVLRNDSQKEMGYFWAELAELVTYGQNIYLHFSDYGLIYKSPYLLSWYIENIGRYSLYIKGVSKKRRPLKLFNRIWMVTSLKKRTHWSIWSSVASLTIIWICCFYFQCLKCHYGGNNNCNQYYKMSPFFWDTLYLVQNSSKDRWDHYAS